MEEQYDFFDRELSWLSFNYRVLQEAMDNELPLYERIKFMAIYSSNLDEFYKVRVASHRSLLELPKKSKDKQKLNPEKVLQNILHEVEMQQEEFYNLFEQVILPQLYENDIVLYQSEVIPEIHKDFVSDYFFREVLPHIQAVLLEKGHIFTFLQDNFLYLSIKLIKKRKKLSTKKVKPKYAIIKIPTNYVPRFLELPNLGNKHYIMFLDDVIRHNLHEIFPGYNIDSSYCMRVSRNADLMIDDEFTGNLAEKIKSSLSRRETGSPTRFLYDKDMPDDFLDVIRNSFKIKKIDLLKGGRYLKFADFFGFPNPLSPKLEIESVHHLYHNELDKSSSLLKIVREKDIALHFPYQSYNYVIRFFNEAAVDDKVEEIKTTQYRVATNSAIVSALISAAQNGKKVTVFVEVQARFDEQSNIKFAKMMKKAGINVLPGIPGIKVHAKTALVIRRGTKDGKKKGYAFISTGNFNEKTAKIYADHGFFTSNEDIISDLEKMFYYLENPKKTVEFEHILVPKFNLRAEFERKIDREIENVKNGLTGYILFKMNSLQDKRMVKKLYQASENNVKIDLIVRGICVLMPNQPYSKNITITRIVDKFLEHARVYVFYNNGKNDTYISSADLMSRNLNRRVEAIVPIYNEKIKKEFIDILEIQLKDNVKARTLDTNLQNIKKRTMLKKNIRAQVDIYNYLKQMLF